MEKKQALQKKDSDSHDDLAMAILAKNKNRAADSNNFFDSLIEKYSKAAEKPKKKSSTKKSK